MKSTFHKLYTKLSSIKHFTTYIFFLGFVVDFVTLPSPDTSVSWIIGVVYMLAVGGALLTREYYSLRSSSDKKETYTGYAYFTTSFFLGSLLSFVFVYYFRSSDYVVSLPIIMGLIVFVILNELIKSRSIRLLFDTLLYFLGSFFFIIFLVPIFVGTVNNNAFIISTVITLLYFTTFFYALSYLNKIKLKFYKKEIAACLMITLVIILLFIFKILPAVPLALKDSGVYQMVSRSAGNYQATVEKKSLYDKISNPRSYNYFLDRGVYFYASVHAPTSITTTISQRWEYYDTNNAKWITYNKIPYQISGGREGGYRAYTYKSNLREGKWRVTVLSADERVIGRYTFNMKNADKSVIFEEVKL
jgi:Protein of unknown function (DUF2914)